jgi:hypothetical protein
MSYDHSPLRVALAALLFCAGPLAECAHGQDVGALTVASNPPPAPAASAASHAALGLTGGAPSVDALLDQFLDALERKDTVAMHRLRVSKEEYDAIIVPGMVAKGEPPREIPDESREFFWQLNDRKSRYAADAIVTKYGGRHYVGRDLRFSKGTQEYLWYTVRGQVRLNLRTAEDSGYELMTGSIAEVDGTYKFIAFQWND